MPLIRATNVSHGKIVDDGLVFVDPAEIPHQRIVWLEPGDIIVVRSGAYTGDSATVPSGHGRSIAGFDMVLRCVAALPSFVQYALLSSYLKTGQIDLERMRAAQPHLNAEELGACTLVCPPMSEQLQIAAFLDRETAKIDALVAEQRRLMDLLREQRQAVISHAVTKGLNPDAPMKDSGVEWLGEVPAHWDVCPLKRNWAVTDCKHVTAEFTDEGFPLASIREVQSRWVDLSSAKRTTQHFYELLIEGGRKPRAGDLIFSRNATVGEVAQVSAEHPPFAMGQDVVLLRKQDVDESSDFLQHVIQSPVVTRQLDNLMIGSTFKRINVEEIRSLLVPRPPLEEQRSVAAFLDRETAKIDALVAETESGLDLLAERRAALITAAVTGQIDVRKLAVAEAA